MFLFRSMTDLQKRQSLQDMHSHQPLPDHHMAFLSIGTISDSCFKDDCLPHCICDLLAAYQLLDKQISSLDRWQATAQKSLACAEE